MKSTFTNKILLTFTFSFCILFCKAQTTVPYTGLYFSSIAVNDYISVAGTSGSPAVWATFATTWGKVTAVTPGSPNTVTYVAATSIPANTLSVFVWNSNVVQIAASAVCKNLYIESGATVNSNTASTGTLVTLTVGPSSYTGTGTTTITNDGNLGTSGTFAAPSFGAADNGGISLNLGNNCFNTVLTGAGSCNIGKIIENFGTHTAGSSKIFTIDQNVNLNATGSSIFSAIAGNSGDDHNINSTFTINANKSVVFTNTDGRFNFASGTSPTQRCGVHIYNINGTLDLTACNVSTSYFYPLTAGSGASNFNALNSNSILMLNVGATGTIKLPRNFSCYNSATPALTGRAAVNIYGTLVPLAITSANLLSGGNITLKSDNTSTGSIGSIGAIAATSYFPSANSNNVYTVERYIPSLNGSNTRRAYTLVNSPITATTVNSAWQEGSTDLSTSSTTAVGSTATGANYNLHSVILSAVNPNIRKGMTVTGTNIQAGTQVLDTASLAAYGATSSSISVVLGYYAQTDNPYLTAGMSVTGSNIQANTTITNVSAFSTITGLTGTATSGTNSVTVSNATSLQVGMVVSATGIPANTTITAISSNTLTISANTTATLTAAALTVTYRILTLSNAATSTLTNTLLNIGAGQILLLTKPVTAGLTGATLTFTNNYGTQITGGVAAGTNGFDGPATSLNSIFTYDDTKMSGKWTALTNTNVNTTSNGYLLFVRGDRSVDRTTAPGSTTASATTLRAKGAIAGGSITPTLTTTAANLFNLVANPYPSAVKWSNTNSVTKTNLAANFYVYDPNNQLFYTSDGTTVSPSPAGSVLISQQQANVIQSGQAFFIQNAATGTPSITFTEASKITANTASNATVFGETAVAKPQLNLNIYRTVGNVFADGVVALFGKDYSANVSIDEDAAKFANFNENFSLRTNDQNLSIEKRPLFSGNDTLHFSLANFGKRDYTFVIDGSNFSNITATLEDKYTATKTPIDLNGSTSYQFTVSDAAASSANDRFIITLGSTNIAATVDAATSNGLFVRMSPNPVANQLQVSFKTEKAEQATINVINSLGQVVKTVNAGKTDNGNITIPVSSLSAGIYTVQLLSGDKQISVQKIVKE